jgi:hypothetical protein
MLPHRRRLDRQTDCCVCTLAGDGGARPRQIGAPRRLSDLIARKVTVELSEIGQMLMTR